MQRHFRADGGTNGREPTVPFEVFDDYTQFRETGYDFVTMAQSPRYAPASADRIIAAAGAVCDENRRLTREKNGKKPSETEKIIFFKRRVILHICT